MNYDWRNDWRFVGTLADVDEGRCRAVLVEGEHMLLARVEDELLLARDRCPLGSGRIGAQVVRDGQIVCPCHGALLTLIADPERPRSTPALELLPTITVDDELFVSMTSPEEE